ncbi:NAD-dependent deacetylase [Anaerosacchariphilus sp. NSJ-68]|uniref:protein acetyllysine N-acetyltransferase n=2 Tax=Lachnospiraceae TaxID=186803 RepID=A0A923LBU1_9FIRM|nr:MULTISPECIES: Sir2 family NAD-dependent protein deacetylase [Lachnospiraceae]MBC5659476.1 NAD-dependent deacetylase [Anaerosacchariphilus hominis]MBC5697142.1 NAD-dependent deacetylase [Roseburia difficilis]
MNDYEMIRDILDRSSYTVAMCGTDMMKESGMPSLRAPEIAYEVEKEFGYSPEEIFSSVFYVNRTEIFFKYYREKMLQPPLEPSDGFYALAELEKRGKLQCSIANNVHNLPGRAGCQKVLNLHGTIYENECPRCGQRYPMEYIRDSKRVPLCEKCMAVIRPKVLLFGEQVDNQMMTRAVDEISQAQVLLLLGTAIHSGLCERYVKYFKGERLILINGVEHYTDERADIVLHEEVKTALPKIVWPDRV